MHVANGMEFISTLSFLGGGGERESLACCKGMPHLVLSAFGGGSGCLQRDFIVLVMRQFILC